MQQDLYTVGQIAREGLLLGARGGAIRNKVGVSRIVRQLKYKKIKTPHGPSKCLTREQIEAWNESVTQKGQ